MYEVKYLFVRTPFNFSQQRKVAHGKLGCCASTETQCHWQILAASICKYDILLTILSGVCTVVQWEPFIQALWYVSCCATCYISCLLSLLCNSCSSITTTPYSPSVWGMRFEVLLNCIGSLWYLPCAVLAPTPALKSVWCFGSQELCSPTDLDLQLGNSAEGKQPRRSGWCLVWTQDRWCGHPGTGSVHDRALVALLSFSSIVQWAQVGSGCCHGDKGLWAGGLVRLVRKS